VRAAEVIAALSLATDLGTGLPFEHGLESTIVAMRLAERLAVDRETAVQTYYACLLFHVGCTADADVAAELFDGDLHANFMPVMFGARAEILRGLLHALAPPEGPAPLRALHAVRRLPAAARSHAGHLLAICEVGEMLTNRLGLPGSVEALFAAFTERWDGKGEPRGLGGEQIPLPVRIVHVARDAAFQRLVGGAGHAARVIRERAGAAFDPVVAAALADGAAEVLERDAGASAWDAALDAEPGERLVLGPDTIDRALGAIGDFADLISPYLSGHSAGVAALASSAAERCGLPPDDVVAVRRAGLVHDLGRVAVPTRIWQKDGPLTADEWEQVRLHPYHAERVLCRSPFLAGLAPVAGAHHERLDGSGYHRGATGASLPVAGRVLAAADAYHALTELRPHRAARTPAEAAGLLGDAVAGGRLDPDAVAAVLEAAGHRRPPVQRPAGLTEREAQVLGLVAHGFQTKHVARALGISAKTADHHIEHAYAKIGVSTRAAAALFAMEHGLAAWGELPMAEGSRRA
jgi:HD-GYP domain-containing protein (c-di-GMP phosphodiesterase class II)